MAPPTIRPCDGSHTPGARETARFPRRARSGVDMFRRIHLSRFKSIKSDASVDLSQLTVITGANSSGKSTVLQALLLLAQTARHTGADRQLVLNGPLTRLGEFD